MSEDRIVKEVRAAREAFARSHGFNVRAMVADLRAQDERGDWPFVRRSPRRPGSSVEPQTVINGRADEKLNFTRSSTPDRFSDATLKLDQEIPIALERDSHVIVATIGEHSKLGPVMGPDHGNDRPVAVSNPIFVDVDGGGFKPSNDELGELPVKSGS